MLYALLKSRRRNEKEFTAVVMSIGFCIFRRLFIKIIKLYFDKRSEQCDDKYVYVAQRILLGVLYVELFGANIGRTDLRAIFIPVLVLPCTY